MAKQKIRSQPKSIAPALPIGDFPPKSVMPVINKWLSVRNQLFLLIALCFVFYGNTLQHGYAFDDTMAIVDNEYVQQGVSGIPKILNSDAYQSYLEHKGGGNQLSGGRYRPLSLITFAIEQQFMGTHDPDELHKQRSAAEENAWEQEKSQQMHFRHFVNVALYAALVCSIFCLLLLIVPTTMDLLPFVVSLLFLVHPIHTEVVANVKSRDEILSLLFICLNFIFYLKHFRTSDKKHLILSLVCFFCALLSKEYALTMIVLLPVFHFSFLAPDHRKKSMKLFLFAIPLTLYMMVRMNAVSGPVDGAEQNVMNNPYLYATWIQKIASEIDVLLRYLRLLCFPHPLMADYSYAQIPYTGFANPVVWVSILINATGIFAMVALLRKRHFVGFALAIYFSNIALVSNFFFNIGAPMGERLVFHSSLGFVIVIGWLLVTGKEKYLKPAIGNMVLVASLLVVTLCCCAKTISRNADWKDNETLFLHDVQLAPNSVLMNNDAAAACMSEAKSNHDTVIRNQWFAKAIGYFDRALRIHPRYTLAYVNRGLCYFNSGNPSKALQDWDTARVQNPDMQNLHRYMGIAGKYFLSHGIKDAQTGNNDQAIVEIKCALDAVHDFSDAWFHLGLVYRNTNRIEESRDALQKALQYNPGNKEAQQVFATLPNTP